MNAPREMHHFLLLDHGQQVAAIRHMHDTGMSDYTIAAATRLSVEMVRRILAERVRHSETHA